MDTFRSLYVNERKAPTPETSALRLKHGSYSEAISEVFALCYRLERQRNELLAALVDCMAMMVRHSWLERDKPKIDAARAVIASVQKDKP